MKTDDQIAVIGAGLAGLTVARMLADAGHSVTVFDKSRGLGGRMASRRRDGWRFDHGAIALRPSIDDFAAFLSQTEQQGYAAEWQDADGWTGLPGMSGVVKGLAEPLAIYTACEVTALERSAGRWVLHGATAAVNTGFDHIILALPQPQAHRLLAPWPEQQAQIETAKMAPCWTLMVGFDAPLPTDLTYANTITGAVSVIARERAKPGRDLPGDGWVIQASAQWSRAHLERERTEIEPALLDAFFEALGCPPVAPAIIMAHRWRFALTEKPLGQPYVSNAPLGLSICGDWCLGDTAQDAYRSGRSLAAAMRSA